MYQSKEVTKKVHNNIIKTILILKLTDKLDLRRGENGIALSNLSIYYTWKSIKSHTVTKNLKYQLQHRMKNLN